MKGKTASKGMAYAITYPIPRPEVCIEAHKAKSPKEELLRFESARAQCSEQLEKLINAAETGKNHEARDILDFQLLMLEDTDYIGKVEHAILKAGWNCEHAVDMASRSYQTYLRGLTDNPYLQERASDVKDLNDRLLELLNGKCKGVQEPNVPYIAVAEDLSPSQVMEMDDSKLRGIILEQGAMNAHAVIIARSRGIPCLIGVEGALSCLSNCKPVLLDAFQGVVIENPDSTALETYRKYSMKHVAEEEALEKYRKCQAKTLDGFQIKVFANITSWQETEALLHQGGEGVGLFRTELLYMQETQSPPSEAKQFRSYQKAAENLNGRPLIIRTLDVGGDKKIPYLGIPAEDNPFLGYRAIRYCLDHKDLFTEQLRAILKASAYGKCAVMFPMIATVDELQEARGLLEAVKDELRRKEILFDENIPVGMMVETPAAAEDATRFATMVDFFSIGTNDLTQYLFAADRTNGSVSKLNSPFQPILLRCIDKIVHSAHEAGIEVDICGQAGEVPELIPLWIGMGVDALSVSIPMIPKVRRLICLERQSSCRELVKTVLQLETEMAVREILSDDQR